MTEITLQAYAKINLSLEILRRREDGYHDIRSLMQGIGLHDVIKITKCLKNGTKYNLPHCTIRGVVVYLCTDAKTIPADMDNLAFRGVKALLDECQDTDAVSDGIIIDLDKRLPVAAGIAGGSGNAAVCMLGVNALLGDPFSLRELMRIGARVGADVPFSIFMNAGRNAGKLTLRGVEEASAAAWIGGIGDMVTPAGPVRRHVILANPGVPVSTREAYEAIDAILEGGKAPERTAGVEGPLFINDLEKYTLSSCREAAELKSFMESSLHADEILMSGSGPTIAAYYKEEREAVSDFALMRSAAETKPGLRVWLTETGAD